MTLFTSIHKVFNFNLVNGWEDERGEIKNIGMKRRRRRGGLNMGTRSRRRGLKM